MTLAPHPRAARGGALAVLAGAAVLAVPVAPAAANPFYDPPGTLPASNGDLVRTAAMKLGVNIPSPNGTATRIMYRSTDTNGQPVAVTGVYIEPKAAWKGAGARPLVTYAAGTQGQGDKCAPSYGLENAVNFNPGSVNVGYETPSIANIVGQGFAVVVTDYVGLGTTDRLHTYVNRLDQGRAVLDAARAALDVPGASVSSASPVGAFGYSQGGGAAASAAELQPSYAPDVNLKAAYAGAPPADLDAVMRKADGTSLTAVIGFAVNGFIQTYPALQPILDAETNDAGKAALAKISTGCIGDAAGGFAFQKTSKWTKSGKSVAEVVESIPQAKAVVDAQRIGRIKPQVPVRITTGTLDDIVPHEQAKQLAADWCRLGANVDYRPIKQWVGTAGTSLNHLGPMLTESASARSWMADRLKGVPNVSNCATVR